MDWYIGLSDKTATGMEAFVFTYPEKPENVKFENLFSYFFGPYRSKSEAMTELRSGKYLKEDGGLVDRVYVKTDKEMDAMVAKESAATLNRILSGEGIRLIIMGEPKLKLKRKRGPMSAMSFIPKDPPLVHTARRVGESLSTDRKPNRKDIHDNIRLREKGSLKNSRYSGTGERAR